MGNNVWGRSHYTGFYIYDDDGIKAKSRNYRKYSEEKIDLYNIISLALFCLFFSSMVLYLWLTPNATETPLTIWIIIALNLLDLMGLVYHNLNICQDERSQWHAAEHKIIWLLENEQPLTLENLRKAPMISPLCGGGSIDNIMIEPCNTVKEPNEEKLKEALRVGEQYLLLKKQPFSLFSSP